MVFDDVFDVLYYVVGIWLCCGLFIVVDVTNVIEYVWVEFVKLVCAYDVLLVVVVFDVLVEECVWCNVLWLDWDFGVHVVWWYVAVLCCSLFWF